MQNNYQKFYTKNFPNSTLSLATNSQYYFLVSQIE